MRAGIENAVSEAMTGSNPTNEVYNNRSYLEKLLEKLADTEDESFRNYVESNSVQKKRYGGKVKAMKCGGAVMHGRGPKYKGKES